MPYGDLAGFKAYAETMGYDITELADADVPGYLGRASRYVDGLGYRYVGATRTLIWPGKPVSSSQINEWPREGASDAYGNEIASNSIPTRVVNATYEAAFAIYDGVDVNRSVASDQIVTREKIDVIEVQYAEPKMHDGKVDTTPVIPAVADLLAPLLNGGATAGDYGITMVVS